MTTIAATIPIRGTQFELHTNPFAQAQNNLFQIFTFILIPLFIAYGILFKAIGLEGLLLNGSAVLIGALLSLAYYFYSKNKQTPKAVSLRFKNEMLSLSEENEIVLLLSKKDLTIEKIGWGSEQDALMPAIRITNGSTTFTIGTMKSKALWTKINQSVTFTDYIIKNETDWSDLIKYTERLKG